MFTILQRFTTLNNTIGFYIRCKCGNELLVDSTYYERLRNCGSNHVVRVRKPIQPNVVKVKNPKTPKVYKPRVEGLTQLAREKCINRTTLRYRLVKYNSLEKPKIESLTYNEITRSYAEWSKLLGIKQQTLRDRFRRGWPIDRVLNSSLDNRGSKKSNG